MNWRLVANRVMVLPQLSGVARLIDRSLGCWRRDSLRFGLVRLHDLVSKHPHDRGPPKFLLTVMRLILFPPENIVSIKKRINFKFNRLILSPMDNLQVHLDELVCAISQDISSQHPRSLDQFPYGNRILNLFLAIKNWKRGNLNSRGTNKSSGPLYSGFFCVQHLGDFFFD